MNIAHIKHNSNSFPDILRDIAAPPKELFVLGEIPQLPMVAIVGARACTDYGRYITHKIAFDLAKAGLCIVSGLAMGIDGIAHKAAIEAGGKTVAVLGNGLDVGCPAPNNGIMRQIIKGNGAVISEFPLGMPGLPQNFPARNRIIAGLSLATIVTEANASSGSLITANFALLENRMVMAVPGNTTSPRSAGPNNLIKTGAKLVTDAVDVLTELELSSKVLKPKNIKADSTEEAMVLELLQDGVNSTQGLIESTEIDAATMASVLSLMEITGKIKNMGAGMWIVV